MQAEQAAQCPEQVDRAQAVTEGRQRHAEAARHGQHGEQQQGQACALHGVLQSAGLTVARGQAQCTLFDALRQIQRFMTQLADDGAVIEQAGLFFTQAHGFAEP